MSLSLKRLFATDKRAETDGRKLFLDAEKTQWLLIARKGNSIYKARLSKLLQENQAVLNAKGPEAEAIATQCFKDAAAHGLLIGWSSNLEFDGALGAYSPEKALKLFGEMQDFYDTVDNFAGDMSNYRAEEVKQEAGNSLST